MVGRSRRSMQDETSLLLVWCQEEVACELLNVSATTSYRTTKNLWVRVHCVNFQCHIWLVVYTVVSLWYRQPKTIIPFTTTIVLRWHYLSNATYALCSDTGHGADEALRSSGEKTR